MTNAILTRQYAATPAGLPRVTARFGNTQSTTLWRAELDPFQNHQRAASALAVKCSLRGVWLASPIPNGFAFVELAGSKEVNIIPWG